MAKKYFEVIGVIIPSFMIMGFIIYLISLKFDGIDKIYAPIIGFIVPFILCAISIVAVVVHKIYTEIKNKR